jgi:hypothetical protein
MHMRTLFFAWLSWLAAIGSAVWVGAATSNNLITNGGFEEGTGGWEPAPTHELATKPGLAHSGNACLTGEVTADKQALVLRRRVPVKAGYRYQFEIWAKATHQTKLVLRYAPPG